MGGQGFFQAGWLERFGHRILHPHFYAKIKIWNLCFKSVVSVKKTPRNWKDLEITFKSQEDKESEFPQHFLYLRDNFSNNGLIFLNQHLTKFKVTLT